MKKNQKIAIGIIAIVGAAFGGWLIYDSASEALGVGSKWYMDAKGRWVAVPRHPERIVSIAPSLTEVLFAIDADDRLVGVTNYCNYPAEAKQKTKIGGFTTPNLEVITSLNPDLILVAKYDADKVKVLESTGLPVVVILEETLDDLIRNIRMIGDLVDAQAGAALVADNMTARMQAVVAKAQTIPAADRVKCYFEVWETPKVAGKLSFLHDMITKAGGTNIFGDINQDWPVVSHEAVISNNPDTIFVTAMARAGYSTNIPQREGYSAVNAVKNNRIYGVNDDMFTRAGPRAIDALETMAKYLYPVVFT